MRVVFMGTPDFAVPTLRALAAEHVVVGVYTRPDAVSGRGAARRFSPVKQAALESGLEVLQPTTLRDPAVADHIRSLDADIIVVAAYGMILPPAVLESARLGAVNVHGSLLPRWRGAAPIQRAVLSGDREVGVCIMQMEEGLDTGAYCVCRSVPAAGRSATELTDELAELGAQALIEALSAIQDDSCTWTEQDESLVTYADKISKSDVALDPSLDVVSGLRRILASTPQAPARLSVGDTSITVLTASPASLRVEPGAVTSSRDGVFVGFDDGTLELLSIKPEGKGAMNALDWARGARLGADASWGPAR